MPDLGGGASDLWRRVADGDGLAGGGCSTGGSLWPSDVAPSSEPDFGDQ